MPKPPDTEDRENRLDEIIAGYLESVERGETPSLRELLDRYPEFERELIDFVSDHWQARQAMDGFRESDPARAQSFGDYDLLEESGRGGMGIVYRAVQKGLGRIVAVKMIITGRLATGSEVRRFQKEAVSAAKLQHPGIVTVYEVGEHEGRHFFSMEYVEGRSLGDLARGGPVSSTQAASCIKPVAEAIHYAHLQGVVHRDLKPSNVLIDGSGQPKITDFGLAKLRDDSQLTASTEVLGTPCYMSPEQAAARHSEVGTASDVYSLGAILYELVTGRPPFQGETRTETLRQVMESEPVSPRLINPRVPVDLETICLRCLEKEPSRRYGSAEEFAQDLLRFLNGEPIRALPLSYREKVWRWFRRQSAMVGLKTTAASVGLFAGPVIALLLWFGPRIGLPISLAPDQPGLNTMAAILALMAVWWLTEAIPLAATAFLPLVLYPVAGIMPAAEVSKLYVHDYIFLFLGGFLIAIAFEGSGLPRRVALNIVTLVGSSPRKMVFGFMVATGAMSMWISNTSSTLIMLPIAASVLAQAGLSARPSAETRNFSIAVMLGIAYAATIGGTATLIGTPSNLALLHEMDITFLGWMTIGVPFAVTLGLVAWTFLVYHVFPVGKVPLFAETDVISADLKIMGPMGIAERRMSVIFATTALLWVFREPVTEWGWAPALDLGGVVSDGTVAMLMAVVCFIVPSGLRPGRRLLEWRSTAKLPWGILFLFGGGLALGQGMKVTGLVRYLGEGFAAILEALQSTREPLVFVIVLGAVITVYRIWRDRQSLPGNVPYPGTSSRIGHSWKRAFPTIVLTASCAILLAVSAKVGMVLGAATGMTALTELMTNLAAAELILPVLSEAARQLAVDPALLLIPATLAASCAFMLPIATPPNAIVYGSGRIELRDMLRAGIWLNLLSIVVIGVFVSLLAV